jgi:predicted NUDIX family NTP pyrophosphohydrolase
MAVQSAGILLYHFQDKILKVFLVHPGGPFYKYKEDGVWTIPKGEFESGEDPLAAARREFLEETGIRLQAEKFHKLQPVKMKSGKVIHAFAAEAHVNPEEISSNTFELTFSNGKKGTFPEVDRAAWFSIEEAKARIVGAQVAFLDQVTAYVNSSE